MNSAHNNRRYSCNFCQKDFNVCSLSRHTVDGLTGQLLQPPPPPPPHPPDNLLGRGPAHVKEEDDREIAPYWGAQFFTDESANEAQLQRNRDHRPQAHATT